ncbi:aminopeptidase N [Dokdonella sp. MW10]|uniref:aminopeptidase N n=1 Tax=Dokdonella sp. MW10 TaxID=2992926 RepID=UPI003F8097D6
MSVDSAAKPLTRLADYRPPAWRVEAIELEFDLDALVTTVDARLRLAREHGDAAELRLDGEALELLHLDIDGRRLGPNEYTLAPGGLVIHQVPPRAVVSTRSRIRPAANSALEGVYLSGSLEDGFLLSQCEAEGFRRVTWCLDRPDVLSRYTVTLRADRARFPVLLAGGNPDGRGMLDGGRHWARFVDPTPKPSYLFALAAGHLECLEDTFVAEDGHTVRLAIWAEHAEIARCAHAMACLKAAFAWDERRFGRRYDLDVFHVVATHDFAMGAMENTGLNIFNSKYLLATPDQATDEDYRHVLAVVGHEYFHHWSGNRVTCRDWFQLSLKEGLTVYREQEFESDLASRTLRRIEDVRTLWRVQFGEDAGPLAHPVRPEQYAEINNFYTATVYDKGAEIVRMLATLLGRDGFRRGLDLYFARHDGQAVTIEDFLAALGDANDRDLSSWLAWYRHAGTPVLEVEGHHDAATRRFSLTLRQRAAKGDAVVRPVPVAVALFAGDGGRIAMREGEDAAPCRDGVLLLDAAERTWTFHGVDAPPVVSLLRGFSAPVRLADAADGTALALLARHEDDGFNRWFAGDALSRLLFAQALAHGRPDAAPFEGWIGALRAAFADASLDPAILAEMLTPADEGSLAEPLTEVDPDAVRRARERIEGGLAAALAPSLMERYEALASATEADMSPVAQARRRLRNRCLALLCCADDAGVARASRHYDEARTLTDRLAAMTCLAQAGDARAEQVLAAFAERHAADPLVLDKWFALQATIPRPGTLERVVALTLHPAFRWENPNKVYALLLAFAQRNPSVFHRPDGAGYRFIGDAVLRLDAITPQVAARLATAFGAWRRYEPLRRALMRAELFRLDARGGLSDNLADIVRRSLDAS